MSFFQLVALDDKTMEGKNSILNRVSFECILIKEYWIKVEPWNVWNALEGLVDTRMCTAWMDE